MSATTIDDAGLVRMMEESRLRLRGVIYRIVKDAHRAEDITQDVLLKIWQRREQLDDPARFGAWSHRIAQNAARDSLKSGYSKRVVLHQTYREAGGSDAEPVFVDETSEGAHDALERREREELLHAKMAALRPDQRAILTLWAFEELSHEEIGRRLGIDASLSKMRLHRAKLALRDAVPVKRVTRKRKNSVMASKGVRLASLLAQMGVGSGQSVAAIGARSGVAYASVYAALKKHRPGDLKAIVRGHRIARRRASRWGLTLEEARRTGHVIAPLLDGEDAAKARSGLCCALNSSKLTMAWRWTTRIAGRAIVVQRAERWTVGGVEVPDFGGAA